VKESTSPPASPEKLQGRARRHINDLLITDAPFLYPPAQLALAALRKASEEEGYPLAEYAFLPACAVPAVRVCRARVVCVSCRVLMSVVVGAGICIIDFTPTRATTSCG
jgi:hypothetical protein